jgi:hypothetical protein
MPARTGKCINFGGCNKADSQEVITIPDGDDFVCPDCEKSLVASSGGRSKSGGLPAGKLKLILPVVLGLGLVGALIAWLYIGSAPKIVSFDVEPAQINFGQTATLKWSVEHASDISIDHSLGSMQPEDNFPVSPRETTTYTVTAKSGSRLVTKSVTLQVIPQQSQVIPPQPPQPPGPGPLEPPIQPSGPPAIDSFTATPRVVHVGETSVLQWSTRNARSVSIPNINPPSNNLPPTGTLSVTPHAPGPVTILLVAAGERNSVRRTVVITVKGPGNGTPVQHGVLPPPSHSQPFAPRSQPLTPPPGPGPGPGNPAMASPPIISLRAFPRSIPAGSSTTLQWSVLGATQVEITPEPGQVGPSGVQQISPETSSTYTLRATGPGGTTQQSVNVEVQERSGPASGTLVWEGDVQGTQLVTIENGTASPGQLISGRLPGVQVIIQPQNEKKVGIASAPSPENGFQRLVLRVFGHGHTRVAINWSTP